MTQRCPKSYSCFIFWVENMPCPNIWDCPLNPTLNTWYKRFSWWRPCKLLELATEPLYIYNKVCSNQIKGCRLAQRYLVGSVVTSSEKIFGSDTVKSTFFLNYFLWFFNFWSEIYSWSRGFVFRPKIMIRYKSSMFASRDVCINFGKTSET